MGGRRWPGNPARTHREERTLRTVQTEPPPSEDEALTAKLSLLDQAIMEDILAAKAKELKIELTEAELDTAFADGKKNISEEEFTKAIARRGLTAADMRDGLRGELVGQKVIEHEVVAKITVSDKDITDFFEANRSQFNFPEEAYRLAQIVVTPVRDQNLNNRTGDDAATPQAATAKAQMLMERLKAGTPFNQLAMDFSEEPQSAQRGGDVGLISASALRQAPPQLRDAVMKSSPGTVSIVSMEGGHTIVLVLAHETAGQRDPGMPQVRDSITTTLRGRREQLLRTAYLSNARGNAVVVNHLARRLVESQGKAPGLAPAAPAAPVETCAACGRLPSPAMSRPCARAVHCRPSSKPTMTACTC